MDMSETTRFARTGRTSALGKLDDVLERMAIASPTKTQLTVMAAEAGMPMAEYIRTVLDCHAFGAAHVANMAADRILRIGQMQGANVGLTPTAASSDADR